MIKSTNQTTNRIIGISSDDFFNKNKVKTKKQKPQKITNKKIRKNLSVEKPKKPINKIEKQKIKPSSNSKSMQLPDVFIEQILELELQLKLKFDPQVFFELINLYSSAIKFYESIKNEKFITYNIGLNLLFSMPEVKSFMEGEKSMTKVEKKENIEKKMQQSEQKITKEKAENMYQIKLNKNKEGKNIINEEFNKQSMSFKKRMEEKKKKYLSSISMIPIEENKSEISDGIKMKKRNKIKNNKLRNKSVDVVIINNNNINKDDYFNDEEILEAKKLHNFTNKKKSHQINIDFSIDKNNFFEELDKEKDKDKEEIKNNSNNKLSFSGSGTDSEKDTLSFTTSDNIIFDINKFHKITNKTLFKEKLKINFDVYICQYYNKFVENTMNNILDDYVKCGREVEYKLIDNSVDFFNQRKELEFLIKGDEENSTTYNQITKAIEELKEDEKLENNKIIDDGQNKVENLNKKYDNIDKLNDEHYLDIIKEKLKLDVVKSLNSFVLK